MYSLYKYNVKGKNTRYKLKEEQICLFGRRNGYIPWLLQRQIPRNQSAPYRWYVAIRPSLQSQSGYSDTTIIIDLKPKQRADNISLYELTDVWGISHNGWTPILLRLVGLFVDKKPSGVDRKKFERSENEIDEPIYEFLYLAGSVKNGELTAKWTAPPASPTNATLLWPDYLKHFFNQIRKRDPGILENG